MTRPEDSMTRPEDSMTRPEDLVRPYLDHLVVERGLSANTVSNYRRDLDRYQAYLEGRGVTDAGAITTALVGDFAAHLSTGDDQHRPLAASSVARAMVAVRSMHRFAALEGLTDTNPAAEVRPPSLGTHLPKALSISQVESLLGAPDRDTVLGLRDAALLELLYGTGARISELVGLDVDEIAPLCSRHRDDVDGDDGPTYRALRLRGKGAKERYVPLGGYAIAAVEAWLVRGRPELATRTPTGDPGRAALFLNTRGRRLSRQSAWEVVGRAAERAGLGEEVSPHTLRHSYATHLLEGGADIRVVQELLGHSSVTTTQIYTLVTVDHLREVYAEAHPRAR